MHLSAISEKFEQQNCILSLQDDSLMSSTGLEDQTNKLDQQQQFGISTVNNGKFANSLPVNFDLNNESSLVSDANLASTSKAAAAAANDTTDEQQQKQQEQQQQQQQPPAMTVAKYTGDNQLESRYGHVALTEPKLEPMLGAGCELQGKTNTFPVANSCCCCSDELTGHLDTMQDELDTLKDLLRGEGVSIDQNMLLGVSNCCWEYNLTSCLA